VTSFFLSLFKNSDHFTVSIRYLLFKAGGLLLAKLGLSRTIGGEDESLSWLAGEIAYFYRFKRVGAIGEGWCTQWVLWQHVEALGRVG
jgi:hypothetical protein